MDDSGDDIFTPVRIQAETSAEPDDSALRSEILGLLARSSLPTLQLAIERVNETGGSVTLSVPGADPRLAECLFRFAELPREQADKLIEEVHRRHTRLSESYTRAYDLASRRKPAAAVRAFDEYFAEVPPENDSKAAADRARLVRIAGQRARRRKRIRKVLVLALSASVVVALLTFACITFGTWGMARKHLHAKEWHATVADADRFAGFPGWLRILIPGSWRSAVRELGDEARLHIGRTENALDEARQGEASGDADAALTLLLDLRKEDSPDYRARIAAGLERLSHHIEDALASHAKAGRLAALSKLLDALAPAPDLVPETTRARAAAALKAATKRQAQRLDQAEAASERRDWQAVIGLFGPAREADREDFLPATKAIADLAEVAQASAQKMQDAARRASAALAERNYRTAAEGAEQYETVCPKDSGQAGKWRKQIADAEAPQREACDALDAALHPPILRERAVDLKQRVEAGDPQRYFACTQKALKPLDRGPVDWIIAWIDAEKALAGHGYAKALDALARAAAAAPEVQGELAIPTLDGQPAISEVTAGQAREQVLGLKRALRSASQELEQHLTKDDKEKARASALGILRVDPSNWAGHAQRAAEAYAQLQLAGDFVLIAGGDLLMGITPALRNAAFQDGAIEDIQDITDATKYEVTVPRFFMSIRLVSVSEYCAFLNAARPAEAAELLDVGPDSDVLLQNGEYACADEKAELPITRVSWTGATAYSNWLQDELQEQLGAAGAHVKLICRLPTEAEWEFAASWKPNARGLGDKRPYGGFDRAADAPRDRGPRSVRERIDVAPSGCCDMSSNVRQWVADWYGPYPAERQAGYHGPAHGQERVVRGGSFEKGIGPSFRRWKAPVAAKLPDVGFRVVVVLVP